MKPLPHPRSSYRIGVAVATLIGLALLFLLAGGSRELSSRDEIERAAVIHARALAEVASRAGGAPENFGEVAKKWKNAEPSIQSIRLVSLDERSLVASTVDADSVEGAPPRRLVREEKPLFDMAQELRAGIETNREEGVARKEEVNVVRDPSGQLTVAAPVFVDGELSGIVQVGWKGSAFVTETTRPRYWVPIVLFLAAVALFWLLSGRIEGSKPLALVATLAVLLPLVAYGFIAHQRLVGGRKASEDRVVAAVTAAERQASEGLRALLVPPEVKGAKWDYDVYGKERAAIDTAEGAKNVRSSVIGVSIVALLLLFFIGAGVATRAGRSLRKHRTAYVYVAPALIGMLILVFFPFFYGIVLSFTEQNIYNVNKPLAEIWNGVANYVDILKDFAIAKEVAGKLVFNYKNFYWTLLFTIAWTIANVAIGVTVGLFLALILNTKGLALRPIYRVLLILPWAVPNYITALIWRGMFHQQFGVVNQVIRMFGGDGLAWFEKPATSFAAVVTTNGWLSFPFMMVISLGALQSIPADLYEAARVDGATRWQQFRSITLPSLKPALIPAIILSVVWTFNMFNIIYLVSAGEPAGSTEILITQAYKLAFEQYRYGYAAAYSTIIFIILLIYGTWQNRVTRATEGI